MKMEEDEMYGFDRRRLLEFGLIEEDEELVYLQEIEDVEAFLNDPDLLNF